MEDQSEADKEYLVDLNMAMTKRLGCSWSQCQIVIDVNGWNDFQFSYGAPERIAGIYDEESYGRYRSYLDSYNELDASSQTNQPGHNGLAR